MARLDLHQHTSRSAPSWVLSGSDLDDEVRATGGGQGTSVQPGSGGGVGSTTQSLLSLPARKTSGGRGLSAGADEKRDKEVGVKKGKTPDRGRSGCRRNSRVQQRRIVPPHPQHGHATARWGPRAKGGHPASNWVRTQHAHRPSEESLLDPADQGQGPPAHR